jgi:hypothetical protein
MALITDFASNVKHASNYPCETPSLNKMILPGYSFQFDLKVFNRVTVACYN